MISIGNKKILKNIILSMKAASSWIIVCHENPDGDTLGSGLALYSLALRLGKEVSILGKDQFPDKYQFIPYSRKYVQCPDISDKNTNELVICVDISNEARAVKGISQLKNAGSLTINIDHHGDNSKFCSLNLVVPEASATAEIVTALFIEGDFGMTKDEATALYVGLSTDNGNFRYSSTTPYSHIYASYLLYIGANQSQIDDFVNQNLTMPTLKLWGKAFSRTEILANGNAALFWLLDEEIKLAEADLSAVDGLVNMLMRIVGVNVAVFICEFNGVNKLSIRSRSPYSARDIATSFGGGGHVQAAGATVPGDFTKVLMKLRAELTKKCV